MAITDTRSNAERRGGRALPRRMRWALWGALSLVAACSGAVGASPSGSGSTTEQVPGGGGSGGAGDGLPCDVTALLTAKCVGCHSNPPVGGAPMPLLTYADLSAPSKSDPSKSMAEVAVARMKSAMSPMPPSPNAPATAAEIAAFEAWVTAGTPRGDCSMDPNPFDGPPQCTSMTTWNGGDEGSPAMHPGGACITCHAKDFEAPPLTIGGTVYATAHEPDDCNAATAMGPAINTATIEITDKNNQVITLAVNSVGNFYQKAIKGPIATPFTAKVKYDGKERAMMTPQTSGDCNACHTQSGANMAPGRILLP